MCGIIGYTGFEQAKPKIIDGLYALEYRGYDSAGLSVTENGKITTIKCSGRVSELDKSIDGHGGLAGSCGIGHTRWATHGVPTEVNAHPHESENLVLVHNGIIENYLDIKHTLENMRYKFVSETDTECAVNLIDYEYVIAGKDPVTAIRAAISKLKGSFAFGMIFKDRPDEIYAVRRDNPLIVAKDDSGCYIASDIPAILPYTREIIRPEEGEIVCLTKKTITVYDKANKIVIKKSDEITWNVGAADKEGYPFYMLKEIHEQPDAIRRTASHRIGLDGIPDFTADSIPTEFFASVDSVSIIGCGSATHAGLVGRYMIETLAGIPVTVDLASEYRYEVPVTVGNTLALLISQSGETADTLAALRLAKSNNLSSLGIINAVGSAIAREADYVMYTNAGPEIAVATTKGYTTQVATLAMIAIQLAYSRGKLSTERIKHLCDELSHKVPAAVNELIEKHVNITKFAEKIAHSDNMFYIGRGPDYSAGMECSLKLKEISYIHSESYAAGELKHGTLSLVTEGTPVIALATDSRYYDKMIGNIREVSSRGGYMLLVCGSDFEHPGEYADDVFVLPDVDPFFSPLLTVVFSQLLAYDVACIRGCDVDHPRNLAKSVTVE